MNKIPNSRGKFVHMLGVCDLAQQTLDELKNELNSILTGTLSDADITAIITEVIEDVLAQCNTTLETDPLVGLSKVKQCPSK